MPVKSSRVRLHFTLPSETTLEVELEVFSADGQRIERKKVILGAGAPVVLPAPGLSRPLSAIWALAQKPVLAVAAASSETLSTWLTWAALGIYLVTRLVGLPSFPIYFFTDEAVQTVLAADLLRDGWRSAGELLPAFFQNGSQYNLGTSVYLQVLPYFFFGKSIWVTRGTAALVTLLAAASAGWIMKKSFKSEYPWLGVLFLGITPAWFLHSRTAFETSLAVTLYAVFLYFYLRYRDNAPRFLYAAVGAGAAVFYSYSPARIVIFVTAFLLLISDWRYHWQHRSYLLRGAGLALLLALPFARFYYNHPTAMAWQMRLLGSVWMTDLPLLGKLQTTLGEYLRGLDPLYWYLPNTRDLPRHVMHGYGHLLRYSLPLGLMGIGLALKKFCQPSYRVLLVAVLAAPSGAAFAQLGITRALFMVFPMAILTALATAEVLEWVHRRGRFSKKTLAAGAFALLSVGSFYMLYDALANGPLWSRSYSLAGMQYGARQIFDEIARYHEQDPDTKIILSPSWANGTDVTARFFFDDPLPFELGSAEGYYSSGLPLDENMLFIMIPEEFENLPLNRFSKVKVEKILPYPDGQPGFYFVRLVYVDDIAEIIAREVEERHQLDYAEVLVGGEMAQVAYTKLDMGEIDLIFDGDPATLVRTWAVNPMHIEINFPQPQEWTQVSFQVGGTATRIQLAIWFEGREEPVMLAREVDERSLPRVVALEIPGGGKVTRVSAEISNINDPPEGHVHVWEVTFQ